MSKNDGGPAFGEFQQAGECSVKFGGMSLRDYFAAKALQGLCAHLVGAECKGYETSAQAHARAAYTYADAMLSERAKGESA